MKLMHLKRPPANVLSPPVLVGLAGGLLGVASREQLFSATLSIPHRVYSALAYSGLCIFVFGVAWLVRGILSWSRAYAAEQFGGRHGPTRIYEGGFADECELPGLHQLYQQTFGQNVPSLEAMVGWHQRNPTVFIKVTETDVKSGITLIAASAKIMPLRKRAINLLETCVVTGTTISPTDIVKMGGTPACVYVGDVIAIKDCRNLLMSAIVKRLKALVSHRTTLYLRPLTRIGLSYAVEYGFTPVNGQGGLGQLYRLSGPEAVAILSRLRSAR
jgi:hypothetical protein